MYIVLFLLALCVGLNLCLVGRVDIVSMEMMLAVEWKEGRNLPPTPMPLHKQFSGAFLARMDVRRVHVHVLLSQAAVQQK
jgi:hypothetical protein